MVAIARVPCGRSEIAQALGHKSVSGAAKQAIADLMEAGLIEYVLPEKPNSRLQKYRRAHSKAGAQ
jgi:ATP-dependent DNA helicase RecG